MGKHQDLRDQAMKLEIPGYGSMKTAELEAAIAAIDKPDGGGATPDRPRPLDVWVDEPGEISTDAFNALAPAKATLKELKIVFIPDKKIFAAISPDPSWTPDKETHIFFSAPCNFSQGGHGYRRELRVFKNKLQMDGFSIVEY